MIAKTLGKIDYYPKIVFKMMEKNQDKWYKGIGDVMITTGLKIIFLNSRPLM